MNKFIFGLIIGLSLVATTVWAAPILQTKLGGTGTSTVPALGQVLVGQSDGTWGPQATSTLGISVTESEALYTAASSTLLRYGTSTSALTEGNNLFYTLARVQAALIGGYNAIFGNATTTNATTTSLAITGLSSSYLAVNPNGSVIATTTPTSGEPLYTLASSTLLRYGTSTSAITEGNNLFWTDTRFDIRLSSSTSLPTLATLSGLSTVGSSTGRTYFPGKIGIATSSPAYDLDVYGTTSTRSLIVNDGSTTGTTTVAIGNPKIGKTCFWNGTNWTLMWFYDNSITPNYATSTTCQ